MNRFLKIKKNELALQPMVWTSAAVHLMAALLIASYQITGTIKEAPSYYVDILELPAAAPQSGLSAGRNGPPPLPETPPSPKEMTLPAPPDHRNTSPAPARPAPEAPPARQPEVADSKEFEEKMARLEREAEARHAAASLDALRKRVMARAGSPGGTGNEAGSDYASYVQSRLKDAFRSTIAYQSRNPEVSVRLTIGKNGRFVRVSLERSTGDRVFEDAVTRAIARAEGTIPPPPTGKDFESVFVFKPQGIGQL